MSGSVWPSKRADGTLSVAARFRSAQPSARDSAQEVVTRWWAEKNKAGIKVERDFAEPPVVQAAEGKIDVVFEARVGSRMWKDWLVQLTDRISEVAGLEFEGFDDRVSGVFRPTMFDRA